jgi:hypothetical protein
MFYIVLDNKNIILMIKVKSKLDEALVLSIIVRGMLSKADLLIDNGLSALSL